MSDADRLKHIEEKIDKLDEKVDRMEIDLAKYRGMVGGVLFIVTAIAAFVKLVWGWLSGHLVWQ